MALVDRFQSRYTTAVQIKLTRPDDTDATTVDSTLLATAASDAEAYFQLYASQDYDDSNARHRALGVLLMYYVLVSYRENNDAAISGLERVQAMCEKLAGQTVQAWGAPTTDGNYSPSDAATGAPPADRRSFDNLKLTQPTAREASNA